MIKDLNYESLEAALDNFKHRMDATIKPDRLVLNLPADPELANEKIATAVLQFGIDRVYLDGRPIREYLDEVTIALIEQTRQELAEITTED